MLLGLLVGLVLSASAYAADAQAGPCSSELTTLPFTLPAVSGCGWRCSGVLHLHTPGDCTQVPAAPYPLVVFVSGFLASAADYFAYSNHLASWGFAVLQYDFHLLPAGANGILHTDEAEVGFLPHFLSLVEARVADPASTLHGQIDLHNLAAAGHSRGAKIAALHFAGWTPGVRAAFLVDPVDGTTATASQPGYPSAVEALRGQSKVLGIAGAGRIGPCNGAPYATGNWSQFWEVSAAGSWLEVVPDAGHLQFADISSLLDLLCCRGCRGLISHQEGIHLAKVPMAAYFHRQLRPQLQPADATGSAPGGSASTSRGRHHAHSSSSSSSGRGFKPRTTSTGSSSSSSSSSSALAVGSSWLAGRFREWVCEQEAAGRVTFTVKGSGDWCVGPGIS